MIIHRKKQPISVKGEGNQLSLIELRKMPPKRTTIALMLAFVAILMVILATNGMNSYAYTGVSPSGTSENYGTNHTLTFNGSYYPPANWSVTNLPNPALCVDYYDTCDGCH